jgi:hypothetical protein
MASVDKIVVKDGAVERTLTPAQWKALPLTDRVGLLSKGPSFFAGGKLVPTKEALPQLR